jgi:hypothetical protein
MDLNISNLVFSKQKEPIEKIKVRRDCTCEMVKIEIRGKSVVEMDHGFRRESLSILEIMKNGDRCWAVLGGVHEPSVPQVQSSACQSPF